MYVIGSWNEGYETYAWMEEIWIMKETNLAQGVVKDEYHYVSIPLYASPGACWGDARVFYFGIPGGSNDYWAGWLSTYLNNKEYENLQSQYNNYTQSDSYSNTEYNQLEQDYDKYKKSHSYTDSQYESLQADYEDLRSKYTGLGEPATASILNYILFMTTVVFLVTTLYFALRKPRTKQVS